MPTLTITTTAAQASRISSAFGKQLHLLSDDNPPVVRDATAAEVKAAVIGFLKATVLQQERQSAAEIAASSITEIEPT